MPDEAVTREILGNIGARSQGFFYALAAASLSCFGYGVYRRVRLWRLGRDTTERFCWGPAARQFFWHVLAQTRLRRGRPLAGAAHALLVSGFMVLLLGTVLIAVEHYAAAAVGRESTDPLFHKGLYFAAYEATLDTFGIALLLGCAWFLQRRFRRGGSIGHHWSDRLVLGALVLLAITGYLVEGLRILHEQTPQPAFSFVGLGAARMFELIGVTRARAAVLHLALWWWHAALALGLIAAFPYTRLLHTVAGAVHLAKPGRPLGVMSPLSLDEVEQTGRIGAGCVEDFSRRQLVELDACVSCGRCEDACPAHEAGKPLSPRDVVQDVRAHLNLVGPALLARRADPSADVDATAELPRLHGETIGAETLWSCTTCHACVDICPLGVDPLGLITDMRRNLIGTGQLRGAAAASLQKMQRSGNPWGLPADQRLAWAAGMDVPVAADSGAFEVLYWVGCAAAYDRRIRKVAQAVVRLLRAADVRFAVLGSEERCTGESARRMGDEFLFQQLAAANLESLARYNVRRIVTHCPHCLHSFRNDYPQFGGDFEVLHHTQLLAQLVAEGKLKVDPALAASFGRLTYHDPCYLARVHGVTGSPRELIQLAGPATGAGGMVEMPRRGRDTACCGAGGGRMWLDDRPQQRVGTSRVQEALDTGAQTVAVSCPFCMTMVGDGMAARDGGVQVKDVAELLAQMVE